ncbi:MAG: T9SS type A sorting domain-containing protein [Ignavibacteriae bacterium]|nr:T9SS type A sorting domain-containing protein [Ignavibacteriota bacterium]
MKKRKMFFWGISLIFMISIAVNNLFSQSYNWESNTLIDLSPVTTSFNSNCPILDFAYDNYGMHVAGLSNASQNYNTLNYKLIDNNGNIIESITNIDNNIHGLSMCSGFGKVYVLAIKNNSIEIFERKNGETSLELKKIFIPGAIPIQSNVFVYTDIAITNDKLHIIYQNKQPGYGCDYLGYVTYEFSTDLIKEWSNNNSYGRNPQITAGADRIFLVYTNYYSSSEEQVVTPDPSSTQDIFTTKEISLAPTPVFSNPQIVSNWNIGSNNCAYTRASIINYDNGLYIFAKTALLDMGLFSLGGQFKKSSNGGTWTEQSTLVENMITGYEVNQTIISNTDLSSGPRIGFIYQKPYYSTNSGNCFEVRYSEYDINTNSFIPPVTLQRNSNSSLQIDASFIFSSKQGDYVVYQNLESTISFRKIRRPRAIAGNITYNTLLTGNEYINSPSTPYCHSNGAKIIAMPNSVTNILDNTKLYIDNGDNLQLKSGSVLNLGSNVELIFSGSNSYLATESGVTVNCGANSSIKVMDGAYVNLNGITFSSSSQWNGIDFINAGTSTITGCTFSDCQRPISIYNDLSHASNNQTITNNTFNLTGNASDRGIYAENLYSLNAQNNTFNLSSSSIGIYIKDYDLSSMENNESLYFSLILKNNIFNSGSISLVLASYMSQKPSYYIEGNTFNNNSYINILGRDMQGTIKNNSSYGSSARALHFTQSDPEVYNNTFYSTKNILAGSQSVVHIEPIITETGIVWYGGRNYMQASGQDNVEYNYGYVTMDYGENRFIRSGSNYHLYGIIEPEGNYYTRNNCFDNSNTPVSLIWDENNNPVNPIIYGSTFSCNNSTNDGIDWVIREIGSGLYDSVKVTALPSGTQLTQEEILYAQAVNNYNNSNYFNAVTDFKSLINQYPGFTSIISSLYKIYTCYENLDTVPNQENRDILYGNLVTYLSEKINSELYSEEFNEIAYNLILGCYTNMTEYNSALDGYEFISLFHPNPELRLLASWDFAEVEALIGTGGSVSSREEKMTPEEFKDYRVKRMNKLIKGDPIKEKMKKTFSNSSKKRDENTKKQLAKLTKDDAEIKMQIIKNEESKLKNKAVNNLRTAKTLTKSEKEKKQLEGLLLSAGITDLNRKSVSSESILPFKYELSQNYPNPFNPSTNIKYQIANNKFVSIKVFDLAGREIAILVNEFQKAGTYEIKFNGSNFASGVYFYRIQAGDFVQVKKMVLVK